MHIIKERRKKQLGRGNNEKASPLAAALLGRDTKGRQVTEIRKAEIRAEVE